MKSIILPNRYALFDYGAFVHQLRDEGKISPGVGKVAKDEPQRTIVRFETEVMNTRDGSFFDNEKNTPVYFNNPKKKLSSQLTSPNGKVSLQLLEDGSLVVVQIPDEDPSNVKLLWWNKVSKYSNLLSFTLLSQHLSILI